MGRRKAPRRGQDRDIHELGASGLTTALIDQLRKSWIAPIVARCKGKQRHPRFPRFSPAALRGYASASELARRRASTNWSLRKSWVAPIGLTEMMPPYKALSRIFGKSLGLDENIFH